MLKFGTDGVRGTANTELTPELALALGRASARVLGGSRVVIGRDTRRSGPMIESALAAGFASEGVDVTLLGVVPTPAVALIASRDHVVGAVISASHNAFPDNGIKLFASGGRKLSDDTEADLEAVLDDLLHHRDIVGRPSGADVGTIVSDDSAAHVYVEAIVRALGGRRLDGVKVVLDCAHGAGSAVAPAALERLGCEVTVVHAEPDGVNINEDAGSTNPEALMAAVVEAGADAGLALDGDADRVLAVGHDGVLVDGDQVMGILAIDRKQRGVLPADQVVVTVMTNLGFRHGMERAGIDVITTQVGDRYVLEAMAETGAVLGGEQSGHVIQADLGTTGDGLLTGVTLLDAVVRSGRSLADLATSTMERLPQVLVNVRLERRDPALLDRLAPAIAAAEGTLGSTGRVLVRLSGTEPLLRVMVEAPTEVLAGEIADAIAAEATRLT